MSRTGPGYVETESELYRDLQLKRDSGEITDQTSQAFSDLYEFATGLGDNVAIGEAKNANFRLMVDAHQGDYQNNPSVFSANVKGLVKIWPAGMPLDDEADDSPVAWDNEDYAHLKREFQSLHGVATGDKEAPFETIAESENLEQFKSMIKKFVSTCREKANNRS